MPRHAPINITPKNGWNVSAISILPLFEGTSFKTPFKTDTVYLGSLAVEDGVKKTALSVPESDRFVEVVPFPFKTIWGKHKDLLMGAKQLIFEQVTKAQKEERGLILNFSAWGGQQSLDVMDLISFTRKISDDRVVCVVGGPEFSSYSRRTAADFLAAGADIVNFGGGKEIAEWEGQLTKNDLFRRDARGNLIAPIPAKAPFYSNLSKNHGARSGGDLPAPVYYDPTTKAIRVYLPNCSCSNECDFCSVKKFLVDRQAPSDKILAKQVNEHLKRIYAEANREKPINAILKKIMARAQGCGPEEIPSIKIANPNPTQGMRFERLEKFLSMSLDGVTGPVGTVYFMDTLSFCTDEGMKRHLACIEKLLTEHKNLHIHLDMAMDAIQEENDGNFIGRRIGKRLLKQEEYDVILKNHHEFLKELSKLKGAGRITAGLNHIVHPAMSPDLYERKEDLRGERKRKFLLVSKRFVLMPFNGTRIAEKYKGHYAPKDYMEKDWEASHLYASDVLPFWGNQFKNGDLLDCISLCDFMYEATGSTRFSVLLDAVKTGWNDGKAEFCYFKGALRAKDEKGIKSDAQKILDTKPRVVGVMEYFMDYLNWMENWGHRDTLPFARALNTTVHWILRREQYLARNNPLYANDPNSRYVIKKAHLIRKELLLKPYAYKFDICPPRDIAPKIDRDFQPLSRLAAAGISKFYSVHHAQRRFAHNTM